ncbi:MAG: aromatic amino acid transaminase, partial [Pseudomonadota bacterium]
DDTGQTPVMAAVRQAEQRLADTAATKAYESPRGNQDFTAAIDHFVFGDDARDARQGFATPGGSGALSLGMALLARTSPDATVWISDPNWPNHPHIARTTGLAHEMYPYAAPADPGVDMDRMIAGLSGAKRGDMLLVQGPCHNPTGIDLTQEQWTSLGEYCAEHGLLPFVDIAYHGFAYSLEEDLIGVRAFLDLVPDALVSYSCSKNFGLYRDRAGALLLKAETAKAAEAAGTHLAEIARATWSMPPAHGPAIVATILGDEALRDLWQTELSAMKDRMVGLRTSLADAIHPGSNTYDAGVLKAQNGMFSQLPLPKPAIEELRENEALYIPGSGRINIAGLTEQDVERTAALVSRYL